MRACGDFWNQCIASMNLIGIEFADNGNIMRKRDAVQGLIPLLVRLESVVALRAARRIMERVSSRPAVGLVGDWWVFVELT